jgi:hypothetical protein
MILQAIVGLALVEFLLSIGEVGVRLRGVHVDDPHQMGFLLIASLAILLSRSAPFPARPAVIGILYFGVLATRTRGVWLAGIVVLAVSLLPNLSGRRVVVVILGAVVAGLLLFGPATRMFDLNPASADIRQDAVSAGLQVATEHPAFGLGWTSKDLQVDELDPESGLRPYNVFVFLAVVAGVPAAVIFLLLLLDALQLAARFHFGALLFISAFTAFSVSEATLYPGSLTAPLFFFFFALAANRSRGVRLLSSSLYAEVKRGIRLAPA